MPKYAAQVKRLSITGPKTLSIFPSLGFPALGLDLLYEICSLLLKEGRIEGVDVDHYFMDAVSFGKCNGLHPKP